MEGQIDTRMCPGSALAAGDDTPANPSGKRMTLSTKADGLLAAKGVMTGTMTAATPSTYQPTARRRSRSKAAQTASTTRPKP